MTVATPEAPVSAGPPSVEALYASCGADVYAYVASIVRDPHAAEDVTALAFERALRKRTSFSARRGTPRSWLFGIARNAALDELRRRRRTASLVTDPADPAVAAAAGEDLDARASVRAALAALEPRDRELVALKFYGELTTAELARVLSISPTNVSTRLSRALARMREALDAPN